MADKKKNSGESKTEEIKVKLSALKEDVKEKLEDCKEKASEKVDEVKEKASEVVKKVKGETEEEKDCRMLVTFSLLAAWGSGYLARDEVPAAVLLGGDKLSLTIPQAFFGPKLIELFSRSLHLLCLRRSHQPVREEEVDVT